MNVAYKLISTILCISLFAACAPVPYEKTASGILNDYLFKEFYVAVQNFGPPTAIYSDGQGGKILSWEDTHVYTKPGISYTIGDVSWDEFQQSYRGTATTLSMPPRTYTNTEFVQFYVRKNGLIYNYRHNVESKAEKKARDNKIIGQTFAVIGVVGLLTVLAVNK